MYEQILTMKPQLNPPISNSRRIIGLLFLLALLSACSVNKHEEANPESNYLIISNAFMMRSNIKAPNAALLIEDPLEISKNEEMFFDNNNLGHACGYHYHIQFWKNSEENIASIPFNQDCEEFRNNNSEIQSIMEDYIHLLETQPTHYIYNLKVPVQYSTQQVLDEFNSTNLKIFLMNGKLDRYTTLSFTYDQISPIVELEDRSKWQGEKDENESKAIDKINAIVSEIKDTVNIVSESNISFPMQSFGGGEIQHLASVSLKFENGTDLSAVKSIITANGGNVDEESIPEFYFVQLVHESEDLDEIKSLLEKHPIVTDVFPYPKSK